MTKYHIYTDKIEILNELKKTDSDTDLDGFAASKGISRRTLSRWASGLGFDLRRRKWKPENARSVAHLNRGDYSPTGERLYLTTTHGLRSTSWLSNQRWTCGQCRWTGCPVRQAADADCVILDQRRVELQGEIEANPYVDPTSALSQEFLFANLSLTLCQIAYRAHGAFMVDLDGVTKLQNLTKYEMKLRDQVIRLAESLGLSVDSKRRLLQTQAGVMDVASRAAALRGGANVKRS